MKQLTEKDVRLPLDIPPARSKDYVERFLMATHNTGNLMLFAGDQKMEHLNDDFHGDGISEDSNDPEHMFKIASKGRIGVFATQFGLISLYGNDYPNIPFLVKLNSKTNLIKTEKDPFSGLLADVCDTEHLNTAKVVGVGYTIYLGSEFEDQMLTQAARIIHEAHQIGLLAVIWIYPRGKAVKDDKDPHLTAGATGVAACLGADFVKVNYPKREDMAESVLAEAVKSAGRTGVICAGGSSTDPKKFLQTLYEQIQCGAKGNATGRNIHQKPLGEAIKMCDAISAITLDGKSVEEACALL